MNYKYLKKEASYQEADVTDERSVMNRSQIDLASN